MRYGSLCFIAIALATNGIAQDIARSVVFDGRRDVDVMANVPSDRLVELTAKMQAALAKDSSWFLKALEASKPGEPLAYDARTGLTEAEYGEYLSTVGKAKVSKIGESWIEMHSVSDGVYSLRGSPRLPMLNDIRIDFNLDTITTPLGVLKVSKAIDAPDSTALGKWQGTQWSLKQQLRNPSQELVQFSLGRRTEDEKNLLILRVRAIDEEKQKKISSIVILYFDPE